MREADLKEIVDFQIEQQGTAVIDVDDHHCFFFTDTTLEFLLEQARKSPLKKAMVMIPKKKPAA